MVLGVGPYSISAPWLAPCELSLMYSVQAFNSGSAIKACLASDLVRGPTNGGATGAAGGAVSLTAGAGAGGVEPGYTTYTTTAAAATASAPNSAFLLSI